MEVKYCLIIHTNTHINPHILTPSASQYRPQKVLGYSRGLETTLAVSLIIARSSQLGIYSVGWPLQIGLGLGLNPKLTPSLGLRPLQALFSNAL